MYQPPSNPTTGTFADAQRSTCSWEEMGWRCSSRPLCAGALRASVKPERQGFEERGRVLRNNFIVKTSYAMSYCWTQKKRRWSLIWASNLLTLFSTWQKIPATYVDLFLEAGFRKHLYQPNQEQSILNLHISSKRHVIQLGWIQLFCPQAICFTLRFPHE